MLHAFVILFGLQLAGEVLAALLRLPVPGMVLGMLLLLGLLAARGRLLGRERAIPADLDSAARGLHAHFGLLFVPIGAGVLAQAGLIAREGLAILAAILLSTTATIVLTALLARGWRRPGGVAEPTAREAVR